ncbi:hypothetical protein FEAC_10350 [Ferrimicrobium acidiphilum DSM 19497]|uniref:Uncharacterized protein n=1 Tax=Ferrimicrobium acidiphilum DSM 19497 TaxID=1121877 RepID=A0A0D8FV00_9ACTN|nr:hypothetical protein FEAC_10350 [Ferrimicrobium acidiphilum DSM 19497]
MLDPKACQLTNRSHESGYWQAYIRCLVGAMRLGYGRLLRDVRTDRLSKKGEVHGYVVAQRAVSLP